MENIIKIENARRMPAPILRYTDARVRAMLDEPTVWIAHLCRAARHRGLVVVPSVDVVPWLEGWLAASACSITTPVARILRMAAARGNNRDGGEG